MLRQPLLPPPTTMSRDSISDIEIDIDLTPTQYIFIRPNPNDLHPLNEILIFSHINSFLNIHDNIQLKKSAHFTRNKMSKLPLSHDQKNLKTLQINLDSELIQFKKTLELIQWLLGKQYTFEKIKSLSLQELHTLEKSLTHQIAKIQSEKYACFCAACRKIKADFTSADMVLAITSPPFWGALICDIPVIAWALISSMASSCPAQNIYLCCSNAGTITCAVTSTVGGAFGCIAALMSFYEYGREQIESIPSYTNNTNIFFNKTSGLRIINESLTKLKKREEKLYESNEKRIALATVNLP